MKVNTIQPLMPTGRRRIVANLILGLDCETSGLAYSGRVDRMRPDPSFDVATQKAYQALSWGFIVFDNDTLTLIDELYIEVKFDENNLWDSGAAKVHTFTKEYLNEHGLSEEEAAVTIVEFILTYWSLDDAIITLGHNHTTFDHWFLRRLLNKYDIMIKLANRHIDTNSLGYGFYDCCDSTELFSLFGNKREGKHNALDDIKTCFNIYKQTRHFGIKMGF